MKKHMLLTLVVGLSIAVLAGSALAAQDANAVKEPQAAPTGEMKKDGRGERVIKKLGLTDPNQIARVREICRNQAQDLANWMKENGAKMKELRQELIQARQQLAQARQTTGETKAMDEAKGKIKAIRTQLKPLREARDRLHENFLKQLKEVLTPDQMEQLREMWRLNALQRIQQMHGDKALALTPDQKAKVKEILKAAHEQVEDIDDPMDRAKVYAEARAKIVKEVLTDEQRAKVQEVRKERRAHATTKPAK